MTKAFTLLALTAILIFSAQNANAQCNTSPCQIPVPQVNAMDCCILPNPGALDCYYGATTDDAPVSLPPSWCTTIQNNHWFAFTADATTATFSISVFGCASGGAIQAAVLSTSDCVNFDFVSPCLGDIQTQTTQSLVATGLTPGENYYLCIDGSGGALCDYAINGALPTVNGPTTGLCIPSAATGIYTTATNSIWHIEPPSAGMFMGSNMGNSVTVHWLEPGPAQICAKSTHCPDAPEDCLDVNIGADVETEEHVDLCQGYTVSCAGHTYSSPGNFIVNLPTFLDCDSIVHCIVHLIPTVYTTEIVNICQGGSATCAGEEFFSPGTYPVKLTAYQGCDSVVNCKIVLVPTYNSPIKMINLCGPTEYPVCENVYTTSGLYSEICQGWLGCDSIVNINLAILEPDAVIAPPGVLDCDNNAIITLNGSGSSVNTAIGGATLYNWSGPGIVGFNNQANVQVNQPGTYCLILTHSRGGLFCADTACVNVTAISAVPQLPQISGNATPCGDSTYVYTAMATGSPSPASFTWTIPGNVPYTTLSLNSIQITWDTVVAGNICVTANNSCGSSQPACLPLAVQPPIQQPVMSGPSAVCSSGGAYLFTLNLEQIGTNYNWTIPTGAVLTGSGDSVSINFLNAVSGQVCVTPQNACGIGTPVCKNVQVSPAPTADLSSDAQICAGDSVSLHFALVGNGPFDVNWSVGNQNQTLTDILNGHVETVSPAQTTVYKLTSVSDNSAQVCTTMLADSVTVVVRPNFSATATAQICAGQTYFVGGALQTMSGVYTDSLQSIFGCDSVIITTLTVFSIDTTILNTTSCDPSLVGTTTQVLMQTNGCDSVVVHSISLLPTDTTLLYDNSCDLANVGVFTQNLTNVYGCDSTVITTVVFALSDTTYLSGTSCDPAATGVFYQNLLTSDGCDSLIITTITQLPHDTTMLSGSSCNPAEVGVFTNVLSNIFGCDSTVITTISFAPLDTTFLTATNCDPAAVGVFSNTIITSGGCDSVVVTTVTLLPSSTTQLTGSSCNPAEVGVFTNVLSNIFGCDSTVITTISFAPLDTTFLTAANCDPSAVGVFANTLVTAGGCDSVIVTTVSLLPSNTTMLTGSSCDPGAVGVFTSVLSNVFGCDSTVITTISLLPSSQTAISTTTCDPALAGVFTYMLLNHFGCDSIVTETRTLLPASMTTVDLTTCDPTAVGTVTQILPNQWGCDSTVVTITSLLPANNCGVVGTLAGSNIPCGATTGALTLTMTVGTAPFAYSVMQGSTVVATGTAPALNSPFPITGLAAGNYTVTVGSANGFTTNVQATIVQLVPPALGAVANSDYSGFDVSCAGAADGTALANANGGLPPYSFTWSNGGNTQQINALQVGAYTVTVVDGNACTNTATVTLTEPTPLVVNFTVNDLDCFGQNDGAIQVETNGGAPPYHYALNDGPMQTSNLFVGLTSGAYTVTAMDANDCAQTEVLVVNAATPLDVSLGDDVKIVLGDSAIIQAVVNVPADSILSVVWTPPFDSSECPQCLTQMVTPFISTVYSIVVQALNGCSDEDKVTVIVDRRRLVYIPNVFSPNSDGANDMFGVYAKPGSVKSILSLQVYDRWGTALFVMENFQPNSPTIGWNGTYKGKPMNPGVFVWVAEIEFMDGEKALFKGDVTIVR